MPVFSLSDELIFPNPELASDDGLLAVGGDLSLERLMLAYENGIFPWFNEEDPPLWWSPPMRAVLLLEDLKISKSLKQELKKNDYEIKFNSNFKQVIIKCRDTRADKEGSWITDEFIDVYSELNKRGVACSVETYFKGELVGGLYGLVIGKVFCGESMFTEKSNASKIALVHLVELLKSKNFSLIDCQIMNDHLRSMGATEISRKKFLQILDDGLIQQHF